MWIILGIFECIVEPRLGHQPEPVQSPVHHEIGHPARSVHFVRVDGVKGATIPSSAWLLPLAPTRRIFRIINSAKSDENKV